MRSNGSSKGWQYIWFMSVILCFWPIQSSMSQNPQVLAIPELAVDKSYQADNCKFIGEYTNLAWVCLMTEKLKMQARLPRHYIRVIFWDMYGGKNLQVFLGQQEWAEQNLQNILAISSKRLMLAAANQTQDRIVAFDAAGKKIVWQVQSLEHAFRAAPTSDGGFILLELKHGQNWDKDGFSTHKFDAQGKRIWQYDDTQITGFLAAVKAKQNMVGIQISKNLIIGPDNRVVIFGKAWQPQKGNPNGVMGSFVVCLNANGKKTGQGFFEGRDWQQAVFNPSGQLVFLDQTIMYDTDWLRLTTLNQQCQKTSEKSYAGWIPGNPAQGDAPMVVHQPLMLPVNLSDKGIWVVYPAWQEQPQVDGSKDRAKIYRAELMGALLADNGKVGKIISLADKNSLISCRYEFLDDWSSLKPLFQEGIKISVTQTNQGYVIIGAFAAESGVCDILSNRSHPFLKQDRSLWIVWPFKK